ncbi:phage tail tape measure protein [Blautia intestinalis]|uniref:phage tail tape measure protein n=1 Tax=Blautia intestinalis TaxID=2763028 RepID=UPI0022E94D10|nr:phage tail tape measure protein [Blautia intestinalis]
MAEVAKVLLSLAYQDNSGEISSQVKQSAEKISKNAGDIDLKLREPDMKGFAEKIQSGMSQINKLVGKKGKLSNVKNISSQMEDMYGVFADSKNGPKQWADSVDKTYEKLSKLASVKHTDLLENLQSNDLKKIIDNYEILEEKQAAYNNARAKAQSNFQEIPKQKVGDIYKEARNSSEESKKYFAEAISKKNLENVADTLGLNLDSKNAETIQGYAQRLALQQFLSDRKSKLKLDKPENVLEAAKLTQQLLTLRDSITNTEDVLKNNFGATKTPSNKITGFTSKILTNELNGFQHQYTQLFIEKSLKEFEDAQTAADKYVLEAAKKRNEKQKEKSEKAVTAAEEDFQKKQNKINERRGANSSDNTSGNKNMNGAGTGNGNKSSNSSTATSPTSDNQIEKDAEDIWKESYEKIKSKYSDKVAKYAISEDEAIERLSKLQKKAKNPDALTDSDLEEFLGIDSRLNTFKEHGKLKNFDAIDDLNDLRDIFDKEWFFPLSDSQDKFKKELNAMSTDQLAAMEEIQKARESQKKNLEKKVSESSKSESSSTEKEKTSTDTSSSNDSFSHTAEEVTQLKEQITQLQTAITDLNTALMELDGSAFSQMKKETADMQKSLEETLDKLAKIKETQGSYDRAGMSTASNVDQLHFKTNLPVFDKVDSLQEFYSAFKNTDAYKKISSNQYQERAFLLKNGKSIGSEYVSNGKSVSVPAKDIREFQPDAIAHTHPFEEGKDNLRFSNADIRELVTDQFKEAMLYCGDELLTMDLSGIKSDNFKEVQDDILSIYQGVFARFGGEIKDNNLANLSSLPVDIQNQASQVINYKLREYLQSRGGNLFIDEFGKEEDGDIALRSKDDVRFPVISDYENQILDSFIKATNSYDPKGNIKKLQDKYKSNDQYYDSSIKENETNSSNEQFAAIQQQLEQRQAEFQKLSERFSQLESQLRQSETEKKRLSKELAQKQEQEKVRQAEETKQKVEPQKPVEIKPNAEIETNETIDNDNVISSEVSEMTSLQEAIVSVTAAVNEKTNAFNQEASAVTSAVESEITDLELLKDAVDNVSKAKEETAQKEEERNQKKKEAEATAEQEAKKKEAEVKADSKKREQSDSKSQQKKISGNSTSHKKEEFTKSPNVSDIPSTYVKNIDKAFDEATAINDALKKSESLKSNIISQFASMPPVSEGATSQIETLNSQLKSGQISVKKYNSEISKLSSSLKHVDDYANNADNAIKKMTQKAMELSNGKASITSSIKKDAQGNDIAKLVASWEGNKFTGTFSDVTKGVSYLTQQTQTSTTAVGQFFDGLKQRWTSLGQYLLSFGGFYQIFDVLKDGFNIIHDLDDALTEMNKVSDEPLDKLKSYQKESFDIANDVGTTGTQIQNSTADFLRLGESFDDAKESAKAANILFNVSEFSSIDEATESLIAMSSAYKDLDKMDIDDKLNNVGNNFSISTDGLATALQKSASALTTAGNDIDKSIALITAGNAVVQDPDSVGAGIRTIALRLTGTEEAKKELEETGEDTSDFIVQTASKVNDSFKAFTGVASNNFKGISLLDENGNLRDTYDVLQDVADIYDEIVETDKKYGTNHLNGLLELMAGKNRANIAASIIQNGDMLKDVYETSQNSEGSALEENQKQLDSISGHLDQLKNKWQQVWAGTASRNQVNFVLDGLKGVLDIVNKIGLVPSALMAGFGLKGAANKIQGKQGILSGLFGWPKIQGYA